jgi:hypothetical protein
VIQANPKLGNHFGSSILLQNFPSWLDSFLHHIEAEIDCGKVEAVLNYLLEFVSLSDSLQISTAKSIAKMMPKIELLYSGTPLAQLKAMVEEKVSENS